MNNLLLYNICIILLYYIINVKGESIIANNIYCSHLKNRFGASYLELDLNELSKLKYNQYLLPEQEFDEIPDNAKLDYFIRYSVISEGLCYFQAGNADSTEEINNYGFATEEHIRYEKTVNCFYYYHQYATPESQKTLEKIGLCNDFVKEYIYRLNNVLENEEWCPYPDFDTMITPIDNYSSYSTSTLEEKKGYINALREDYNHQMVSYIKSLGLFELTECIVNNYNEEYTNCGYRNKKSKDNYCLLHGNNPCCKSNYNPINKSIKFDSRKESFISGISAAVVILAIGSYFSAKYINDIRIQDNIKKSIRSQEKEYSESNKQKLKDARNQGYDINNQGYNTRSRNLNSGTLRSTKPNTGTLRSTAGSTVSQARSNVSTTRYPPNTFNVAQDYQSTDSQDISLRRGMVVQLVQQYEGGWVMVRDLKTNRQGYAPEYCLGNKLA